MLSVMPGLMVAVRGAAVALTLAAAGAGVVGCGRGAQADKPRAAAARVSGSPVAARSSAPAAMVQAPGSRRPGIYIGDAPWTGPRVRPRAVFLGADWNIEKLRWSDWTRRDADGRGFYRACAGADGPCISFWARIRVRQVREHHGRRYFALMKLTGRHGKVKWLHMSTSIGLWFSGR